MARYQIDAVGIDRWERDITNRGLAVTRSAIRTLANRIIDDAPVDTGFMVASSKVRLNPSRGELAPRDQPKGYWEPEARERKQDEVLATTATMSLKDTFGLSFVASYTQFVHEGTSKQAAQPFIDINVSAWPVIVRKAIAEHKG